MPTRLLAAAVLVALALSPAATQDKGKADKKKKGEPTLGDKVVEFCQDHKGEQVGDGECASLANHALKAADARGRGPDDPNKGDYTWGKLVFTLEAGSKPTG